MSSISMEIPTLQINPDDLKNLISFIYKHEQLLKHFGAIKLQMDNDCRLALKKRRKNLMLPIANKRILKMSVNDGAYSIEKSSEHSKKISQEDLIVTDEHSFWSSLRHSIDKGRYLNSVTVPNASFFTQKTSRIYFDIHRLPNQSLLKLGGTELIRQFNPYVRRSLRPGAIFPLTCSEHRLYTIDYHHEGGDHHWYFIPDCERTNLQKILHLENSSICLDHEQIFLDPILLEKNSIRHHRIVQRPTEFIVMASGTLAQSFTQDASWSESINFALPSWIQDGHAINTFIQCQCDFFISYLPKTIDLTLFRRELIQKYITSSLDINYNNEDKNRTLFQESNEKKITSNNSETCYSTDELTIPSNIEISVTPQTISSSLQTSPLSLMTSSIDSVVFDERKTHSTNHYTSTQYEQLDENIFHDTFRMDTLHTNQTNFSLNETTPMYAIVHDNSINSCNHNNKLFSMEELLDLIPLNSVNIQSDEEQRDESSQSTCSLLHGSDDDHQINYRQENHLKNRNIPNEKQNNRRTLFLSGLQANIDANIIRNYFTGSIKVTIKRYRTTSYLKYAFIVHRTYQDARRNLHRFADFHPFGSQSQLEFVKNNSNNKNEQENNKIMVSQIPLNVTRNDLYNLFVDCRIIEYCSARFIQSDPNRSSIENNTKLLWGHATLLYDNEQLASNAIQHVDQYKINGQQLTVSLFRHKKFSSTH